MAITIQPMDRKTYKQTERQVESNIITEKLQNRREKVDYKNTQQI